MRAHLLIRPLLALALAILGLAVVAPAASAQATRTWVSGVGDDANPCSRTAPCKTWAGAISKTAVGGEIDALDDGGFGAVTITKAITIDGSGHTASALASGTNAITINAPTNAQVVLRDIDVKGLNPAEGTCGGLTGVLIVGAASVRLDGVTIAGFQKAVDTPLTNSSVDVFVDMSFNDVQINDNCQSGMHIAPDVGHAGRVTVDGTRITGSNVALSVASGGEAWVSNSSFYLNNVGVQPVGSGLIHSLCNNHVAGNASDGAFSDDARCGASPTATTYCAVPKLKGKTLSKARAALTAAGCKVGKVRHAKAHKKKRRKVLKQTIPAGTEVRQGTGVGVVLGK